VISTRECASLLPCRGAGPLKVLVVTGLVLIDDGARSKLRSMHVQLRQFAFLAMPLSALLEPQPQQLDLVLERVRAYLVAYEEALSTVVADEAYEQRTLRAVRRPSLEIDATGVPIDPGTRPTFVDTARRRLQSTVSFMRLPGGAAWLGTREVKSIDKRPLANSATLVEVLTGKLGDTHAQATALAHASAQHNLGNQRSVNMPTLPLELLDRRHRDRMAFRLAGSDAIRGVRTTRIAFEEKSAPTLIRGASDGHWVLSRGFVWIDAVSGDYVPAHSEAAPEGEVLVDFVRHAALGMLVPDKMREVFHVPSGRGEGEAKYSNYRRFMTTARIRQD
jgi:hypothetical protein